MANWKRLTRAATNAPVWINFDMVCRFEGAGDEGTKIHFSDTDSVLVKEHLSEMEREVGVSAGFPRRPR